MAIVGDWKIRAQISKRKIVLILIFNWEWHNSQMMIGSLCTLIDMHRKTKCGFFIVRFVLRFPLSIVLSDLPLSVPHSWATSNITIDEQKKYTMNANRWNTVQKMLKWQTTTPPPPKFKIKFQMKIITSRNKLENYWVLDDLVKSVISSILIGIVAQISEVQLQLRLHSSQWIVVRRVCVKNWMCKRSVQL